MLGSDLFSKLRDPKFWMLSLIKERPKCMKSELDLFGVPLTQISVEHGYWEQKGLTSTLTDQGTYAFAVSEAGDDYIDLFNTYLFVEAQISQEFWCTRAIFNRRCLSMCSVASSDDVWAFSVLQLVL
jgi:hypothetical protein